MPSTVGPKGVRAGYTSGEEGWGGEVNASLRLIEAALLNAFAQNTDTTAGLLLGYKGGYMHSPSGLITVPDGTILMAASTTNFVERTVAGVVSVNQVAFTLGRIPMGLAVTNSGAVTSYTDMRHAVTFSAAGALDLPGVLRFAQAVGKIIPGTASLAVRDTVDSQDNILVQENGDLTVRGFFKGNGSLITALNAANLASGILPSGRLSGTYAGVTGLGSLVSLYVDGPAAAKRHDLGSIGVGPTVIDWKVATTQRVQLTGSPAQISFLDPTTGAFNLLEIQQDGAGNRLVSWLGGAVTWESGIPPVLQTGPGKTDLISLYFNGSTYLGQHVGSGF